MAGTPAAAIAVTMTTGNFINPGRTIALIANPIKAAAIADAAFGSGTGLKVQAWQGGAASAALFIPAGPRKSCGTQYRRSLRLARKPLTGDLQK